MSPTKSSLRDVGLFESLAMHPEIVVSAVAKELRSARPEVGEPGDELLGRRGGRLVEVNRGHAGSSLLGVIRIARRSTPLIETLSVSMAFVQRRQSVAVVQRHRPRAARS